jgi:hypothetical protein
MSNDQIQLEQKNIIAALTDRVIKLENKYLDLIKLATRGNSFVIRISQDPDDNVKVNRFLKSQQISIQSYEINADKIDMNVQSLNNNKFHQIKRGCVNQKEQIMPSCANIVPGHKYYYGDITYFENDYAYYIEITEHNINEDFV